MNDNPIAFLVLIFIAMMSTVILMGINDIINRLPYTTCEDVGLGERKGNTIHPKKGTIIIYCKAKK